jgi:hypothetical protein
VPAALANLAEHVAAGSMTDLPPLRRVAPGLVDASVENASEDRDEQGRLKKGNPGRPKGSRNKHSLIVEQMMQDDMEEIVATCLRLAKDGDLAAIREILARVAPVRKGAPIAVDMPAICSVADVPAALAKLPEHVAAGLLSPEEARSRLWTSPSASRR